MDQDRSRLQDDKMRLMVSVVSATEARQAILCGADLLDIKNPAEGSLGAQPPKVIGEIRSICSGNVEISAAVGDMPNLPGTAALAAVGAAVCGADYIKIGLHGARTEEEALTLLRVVQEATMRFSTRVVAGGYADHQRAGTLDPTCLPRIAALAGIRGCLLDTAIKDGQTLLHFLSPEKLAAMTRQAHDEGLLFGAAGTLRENDLPLLRDAGVDVVGVRTALCRNGYRKGPLEPARVRSWLQMFKN